MDQKILKGMLPGRHYDDPKRRGLQDVPRETPLIDETAQRGPDVFENGSSIFSNPHCYLGHLLTPCSSVPKVCIS